MRDEMYPVALIKVKAAHNGEVTLFVELAGKTGLHQILDVGDTLEISVPFNQIKFEEVS